MERAVDLNKGKQTNAQAKLFILVCFNSNYRIIQTAEIRLWIRFSPSTKH